MCSWGRRYGMTTRTIRQAPKLQSLLRSLDCTVVRLLASWQAAFYFNLRVAVRWFHPCAKHGAHRRACQCAPRAARGALEAGGGCVLLQLLPRASAPRRRPNRRRACRRDRREPGALDAARCGAAAARGHRSDREGALRRRFRRADRSALPSRLPQQPTGAPHQGGTVTLVDTAAALRHHHAATPVTALGQAAPPPAAGHPNPNPNPNPEQVQHHKEEWRAESLAAGSVSTMPQLAGTSWQVFGLGSGSGLGFG